jgi:energy-coupling factor transport system substrate-specific component
LTIGWGLELLGLVPFKVLALLIFVNNSAPVLLLSLPILLVLYPRISRWGLLWTDIVGAAGVDESVQKTLPGALFIGTGILLGLAGGLYISLAAGMNPLVMAGAGLLLVFIGAMF